MLPRSGVHVLNAHPTQFYTYKDLADMWRVKPQTVRLWFMQLRRAGKGPSLGQVKVVQTNAARRIIRIRSDYALFIQQIKLEGMK